MNISQRQATIAVLGFQWMSITILWLNQIFSKQSDSNLTLGAGIAAVVYGGMLFAYIRGWEYARHISVVLITLIVAVFLPEPFVTMYAPFLLLLAPILALVLVNPLWVIGSAVVTIGLLLVRAGGTGVYANIATLINYAMLIAGLVVSRMVTETVRARVEKTEEVLNESEERFRKTFRSVPVGLAITRASDGTYIDANDAFSEITGFSLEELTGQTSLELNITSPEQRQDYSRQISEQGFIHNQEMVLKNKSGRLCVVLGSMEIIELNHETCVLSTAIDITGRKQTEESSQKIYDELERQFQQRTTALSQTTALLETMLEYVPDQIYFKDSESRFIKNSKSQAAALGLNDPMLVVGKTDFDFFPHAQRSFDEEQEIIRSGKPLVDFEEEVIWPDGKKTWVSTTKVPLRNQEGKVIGTFGISRDITERKHAEEFLRNTKDELEVKVAERTVELIEANNQLQLELNERKRVELALLENEKQLKQTQSIAGLGNYFIDLTTGNWKGSEIFDHILGVDDTFERTMETWPTLIHPNDRQMMSDYFSNEVIGKRIRFDKEYRIIRKNDQAERWVHTLGELEFDSENRPVKMIGTIQDITESKQIKAQVEYQAHLLKKINDAVIATDDQYNITVWNHGAEILYGWSADEAVGHKTTEILPSDMTSTQRNEILRQLHESGEYHIQLTQYRKDGQPVYVDASTVSLYNESGQVTGLLSINRDISERKQSEAALQQSEERFSKAFQSNPAAMIITRMSDGQVIDVNESYEKILEYQREELVGNAALSLNIIDDPAARQKIDAQLSEHGSVRSYETKLRTKSGSIRDMLFSLETISLSGEACILSIFFDVTERNHAENALRESESNARSLLRLSKKLEQAQAYSEALGAALDEVKIVLGYQNVWAYLLSEDKEQLKLLTMTGGISQDVTDDFMTLKIKGDRFLEEISEGKDIILVEDARIDPRTNKEIVEQLGNRTIVNVPIIFMDKQLGIFGTGTFGDEGVHIPTSAQLDYLRALSSHLAVTLDRIHLLNQRKKVEAELYKSEELLRLGYDTAKLGIWQNIITTGMINFDERASAHYGFEAENVPLADVIAHVHPDDIDRLNQAVATTNDPASDGRYGTEYRVIHPNGSVHWLAVQARVYYEGEDDTRHPISWFGTSQDITERKESEEEIRILNETLEERITERTSQLEAVNKELEAFSYSVSHDLRSPLRGIDGWGLALLEDYGGLLDEQGQAHIQRVRAETQRMGVLIDDILQLSRITRAEMNKEKVDLSAIAETVVARLQEIKSEDRQVEFVIQKGVTAMGDPKLLDIVLTNLLGNAFKFTSKKQDAHIEFGQTVVEGENAFFVCDNGAGFDMTYANKLFGAFQRMHRVSEFPGTGVGLATVQRVINRHGGSIWASSEVDQGATFYFTLEDKK
ncbi:MAG: PAS domain S-box protein [Anaerolineales bacterium]|nr:PAS domain S-box protein [Anaerolineales bacterium]